MAEHCPYLAGNMDHSMAQQQEARNKRRPIVRAETTPLDGWKRAPLVQQQEHMFGTTAFPRKASVFTAPTQEPERSREAAPYSIHSDFITSPTWLTMRSIEEPPDSQNMRRLVVAPVTWEQTIVIDPDGEGGIYPNNGEPLPIHSEYFTELTLAPYQLNNTTHDRAVHLRFLSPAGITILHHPISPNRMKQSGLKLPRSQKTIRLENVSSDVRAALAQSIRHPLR